MKQKVTVFGSFVVDLMARTPHLPVPGETVRGSLFKQGAGGKGFNQGIAAHKAGGDVVMITKVGKDSMANVAFDAMDAVGLSKEYVFVNEEVGTGIALISVDENTSQNEIVIVPGACNTITDEDLANAEAYNALPVSATRTIDSLWTDIMSNTGSIPWLTPVFLVACIGIASFINLRRRQKNKRKNELM